jgi:Fic family protein
MASQHPPHTSVDRGVPVLTWPETTYGLEQWKPEELYDSFGNPTQAGTYYPNQPPLIAKVEFSLPTALARQVETATAEILSFEVEVAQLVAPFSTLMLRSEAAASSEIENLSASPRTIIQAEIGLKSGGNAEQIAANTEAMLVAIERAQEISTEAILQMHQALMSRQKTAPIGAFRDGPVWIGALSPVTAQFVGMNASAIPAAMDDLLSFANRDDISSLVKAAITHAHFENIHPFDDGNGRTGRALIHAMLRKDGLTRQAIFPLSAGLLVEPRSYYAALDSYRAGDAAPIISQFAESATRAIRNSRALAADIAELHLSWAESLAGTRKDSSVWKVIHHILGTPVFTMRSLRHNEALSLSSAYEAVSTLEQLGILTKSGKGERSEWRSEELLEVLARFAARAGHRKPGS